MIYSKNIISILGKTNVGKSTLFNTLLKKKYSIITQKKNTTIRCVVATSITKTSEITIIDTPGPIIHNTHQKYNTNKYIYDVIKKSDILIITVELFKLNTDDFFILELTKKLTQKKILLINKIDKLKNKSLLLQYIKKIKNIMNFTHIIPISSKKNININKFKTIIADVNKNKVIYNYTNETKYNLIKDIIRESLLKNLNKEIPYTSKIIIENKEININIKTLYIILLIKKINHKKIIIGKNGENIKNIIKNIQKNIKKIYKNINHIKIKISYKSISK